MDEPDVDEPDVENQGLIILNINNTKNNNINNTLSSKKSSLQKRNRKYIPLAFKLSKIIQLNKNIKHSNSQIKQWANPFRQLEENMGVNYERIEKALDWYKINIGGEYIPVIESGQSFKDKFSKLEAAIERDKNKAKYKDKYIDDDFEQAEKEDLPDSIKNLHR